MVALHPAQFATAETRITAPGINQHRFILTMRYPIKLRCQLTSFQYSFFSR